MPRTISKRAIDAERQILLDWFIENGVDLSQASRDWLDRNHAYLHQYLFRGTPSTLGERERAIISERTGISEDDLGRRRVRRATLTSLLPATKNGIPYGGIVEASAWREADQLDQQSGHRRIALSRDPRYPKAEQYAFEVRGDSMDAAGIIEGMWLVVVKLHDWSEWYGGLRDGMLIVARASRNHGQEIELTVKELRIFPGRAQLVPKSHNPKHKPIDIELNSDPPKADEVSIIGVVVQSIWLHGPTDV